MPAGDPPGRDLAPRIEQVVTAATRRVAMHKLNPHLADKSQRQIEWVHARLLRDAAQSGEPLNVVLETRSSRATREFARYCVRRIETRQLADLLLRLKALDQNDVNGTATLLDQLQIRLERLDQVAKAQPSVETKRRTRASRLKLHPSNWQQLLIEDAAGKLRIALLILHLTGCRPCEIERGIHFNIGPNDAQVRLTLEIIGAKCDEFRGQPLRTFEFLKEDLRPMVAELIADLSGYMEQASSTIFRFDNVTQRVSRHALKLWPSHEARPTAYSFRYAFRKHMALVGATRAQIARAMGHQSIESAQCYGRQVTRQHTLEPTMDISSSIEPRYRRQTLKQAIGLSLETRCSRIVSQDIGL